MQEPLTLLHNPSVQFGEQLYMQFGPYVPLLHAIKNILQFIFLKLKNLYNVTVNDFIKCMRNSYFHVLCEYAYFCYKKHLDILKHTHYHSVRWLNCKKRFSNNFHYNDLYNLYQTFHVHNLLSKYFNR